MTLCESNNIWSLIWPGVLCLFVCLAQFAWVVCCCVAHFEGGIVALLWQLVRGEFEDLKRSCFAFIYLLLSIPKYI